MVQEKSRVVIVPCDTYEEAQVYAAMRSGIALLGGMEAFVRKEERILVKPNFLTAAEPGKAVVTHPAVIRAMLRILHEEGYKNVAYGDSPGHGSCEGAAKKIDLPQIAAEYGAVQADMAQEVRVDFPEGMTAKEFYFAKGVTEADAILNLCKMKTHALERVTGAVKNVYGLICGHRKAMGHVKYPNASVFARMLADIHRCVKPRLHIMDGIVAMEGNGPGSGVPTPMKVLLFSKDPVALDAVFCEMVALDPELVPTNVQGEAMGIGTYRMENIEIVVPRSGTAQENGKAAARENGKAEARESGETAEKCETLTVQELRARFANPQFDVDRKGEKKSLLSRYSALMTSFARRPVIRKELCVKCGICVNHCPVPGKAVDFKKGKDAPPVYDYSKCIRCYCCQEMCPQHAITVRGRS